MCGWSMPSDSHQPLVPRISTQASASAAASLAADKSRSSAAWPLLGSLAGNVEPVAREGAQPADATSAGSFWRTPKNRSTGMQ
eukprot:CAMPEP_0180529474 /NCGR_PEP_ID=MMETSP1036_2-20121128/61386_1 /TAXON_ID=632150 /ORGANISM="Azadinium spinosum, Strain 3D9" /LENGTH=82 /DNA_ID=CAMNT_0022543173 /DNA_START=322 /DNA_END=571 /DNA_ORIENTATION=-